jgi:hypothetical protein
MSDLVLGQQPKLKEEKANSDTWLKLTMNGFEPKVFIVNKTPAKTLYRAAKNWLDYYFTEEFEIISDSLDNHFVIKTRMLEAFHVDLKRNTINIDYRLKVSFKDGKYRVGIILDRFLYHPRNLKYMRAGSGNLQPTNWGLEKFYDDDGLMLTKYHYELGHLAISFQALSESLNNFLTENLNKKQKTTIEFQDDWE